MKREYIIIKPLKEDVAEPASSAEASEIILSSIGVDSLETREVEELQEQGYDAVSEFPVDLIAPLTIDETETSESAEGTWGLEVTGVLGSEFSGKGITVAILDTGIDRAHPTFAGVKIVEEDFTGEGIGDENGHGTHVAGTVFGQDVDGTRIGVARKVEKALIGKVLNKNGKGTTTGIVKGLRWAYENGAHVVCMSLGMNLPKYAEWLRENEDRSYEVATDMALQLYLATIRVYDDIIATFRGISMPVITVHSMLVVAAAGNGSNRTGPNPYILTVTPPAVANGIVSVGALGRTAAGLGVANFSNRNPKIAAPGVNIKSAKAGSQELVSISGTSMAAPHVAGIAALWGEKTLEQDVNLTAEVLQLRLFSNTYDEIPSILRDDMGYGLVQAPRNSPDPKLDSHSSAAEA